MEYQDETRAFVDDYALEDLIRSRLIKEFYRPSERRRGTIRMDAVRSEKKAFIPNVKGKKENRPL